MLNFGLGAALIIIGLTAQYLIKKRLRNAKVARVYAWIAWVFASLGGVAASSTVGNTVGVTATGAAVVSAVMLLVLIADVVDKRPDWPAFVIVVTVPWFMRLSGGTAGQFYTALLYPLDQANTVVSTFFGI